MRNLQSGIRRLQARIATIGTTENYCGCGVERLWELLKLDPPDCAAEVHNPRPEMKIDPAINRVVIMDKLFPEGIIENPGHYAAEAIEKKIESEIILESDPDPEPEPTGDPIRDAVVKKEILNRKQLAEALLIPQDVFRGTETVANEFKAGKARMIQPVRMPSS